MEQIFVHLSYTVPLEKKKKRKKKRRVNTDSQTEKNGKVATVPCPVRQENGATIVCVIRHTDVAMDTKVTDVWLDPRGLMWVRHVLHHAPSPNKDFKCLALIEPCFSVIILS